eukprot:scaffold10972_cov127-Isochrysis_galbana.AAC.3
MRRRRWLGGEACPLTERRGFARLAAATKRATIKKRRKRGRVFSRRWRAARRLGPIALPHASAPRERSPDTHGIPPAPLHLLGHDERARRPPALVPVVLVHDEDIVLGRRFADVAAQRVRPRWIRRHRDTAPVRRGAEAADARCEGAVSHPISHHQRPRRPRLVQPRGLQRGGVVPHQRRVYLSQRRAAGGIPVLRRHHRQRLQWRGHQLDEIRVGFAIVHLQRARAVAETHLVPGIDGQAGRVGAHHALQRAVVVPAQ